MITTLEDAKLELAAAQADAEADNPEPDEIEIDPRDLVVSVCFSIEDDELAREFCRTELGFVPIELEPRLGRKDWIV